MDAIEIAHLSAKAALAVQLPDRWSHVMAVARLAEALGGSLADVDYDVLVQAAWLQDIGYSPTIVDSGFHPLDGARHLAAEGVNARVVALVANHSGAAVEARVRGIDGLVLYPDEKTTTRDALWFCDASIGPRGQHWSPRDRWDEVRRRYGFDHIVARFLDEAEPMLQAAVDRIESQIRDPARSDR